MWFWQGGKSFGMLSSVLIALEGTPGTRRDMQVGMGHANRTARVKTCFPRSALPPVLVVNSWLRRWPPNSCMERTIGAYISVTIGRSTRASCGGSRHANNDVTTHTAWVPSLRKHSEKADPERRQIDLPETTDRR